MKYKVGDYVLIDLSSGDVSGIGISPEMEYMQKSQPRKGLRITKVEKNPYIDKHTFYKLSDTRWTFAEEWLRPARIYKTGGNV